MDERKAYIKGVSDEDGDEITLTFIHSLALSPEMLLSFRLCCFSKRARERERRKFVVVMEMRREKEFFFSDIHVMSM
jgi:hypothetical protein